MHDVRLAAAAGGRKAGPVGQAPGAVGALAGVGLLLGLGGLAARLGPGAPLIGTATAFVQAAWPLWHRQQVEQGDVVYESFVPQARAELREAAWLAALVLPAWGLLATWWLAPAAPSAAPLVSVGRATYLFVSQWLTVAAPEEWFWRGYVQPALVGWRQVAPAEPSAEQHGRGPTPWRRCLPMGAVASCALFALAHLARQPAPAALATFLPSLLFAALYSRRQRLLGASLLHAACNSVSGLLLG